MTTLHRHVRIDQQASEQFAVEVVGLGDVRCSQNMVGASRTVVVTVKRQNVRSAQVDAGLWWVWTCLTLFYAARVTQHVLHVWLHWQTSAFGLYLRAPAPEKASCSEAAPLLSSKPATGSGIA